MRRDWVRGYGRVVEMRRDWVRGCERVVEMRRDWVRGCGRVVEMRRGLGKEMWKSSGNEGRADFRWPSRVCYTKTVGPYFSFTVICSWPKFCITYSIHREK